MSHPCHHWYRIMFTNGKTHLVTGALRDDLVAEMLARDCPINHLPYETTKSEEYAGIRRERSSGLDLGGMCHRDEPSIMVKLDNLPIEFACSQFRSILRQLENLEERRFVSGKPYYKLHGAWWCHVYNPRQHRLLAQAMRAQLEHAETVAHTFFANLPKIGQVLAQAQGLDLPPHELATSHSDLYAGKPHGDA